MCRCSLRAHRVRGNLSNRTPRLNATGGPEELPLSAAPPCIRWSTSRLLEILSKHVKLALELRQFRFDTREAFFHWRPARGRDGGSVWRRSFDFTREQVCEARLLFARLALEFLCQRRRALCQAAEDGLDFSQPVERVDPRHAPAQLPHRLRAAQHQHAHHHLFATVEIENFAQAVRILM